MSPAATHDVHRGALPFPRSLPEFQRLFPDDAACGAAGTIMRRTHSPLSTWFWAAYLVSTQTPGMSATQFARQLGLPSSQC
jgi:hypothetical protein